MKENELLDFKKKISEKKLLIGTLVTSADPIITEILCNCGFDFIWIEGEHTSLDKRAIDLHIMASRAGGVSAFVRIPWVDPVLAKPILEMGPDAIIFPFTKTVEDARLAVKSCKYPPAGIRGFGPKRANNFSFMENNKYFELSKNYPMVILQIEHIDAVNNLHDILKVEGIDSIVVGPNDLSASIGLIGQTNHPDVLKLLDKIAYECNEANISFGASIGFNEENISRWLKRGTSWLAVDGDIDFLVKGGKKCYQDIFELNKK